MKKTFYFTALFVATSSLSFAICEICGVRAPIRPIDHACLPAGAPASNIPLYREDIDEQYIQIAYIDSFICQDPDAQTIRRMLQDVQEKARVAGADAVIRVKKLSNKRTGFIENPRTPFPSIMQGQWEEDFMRGIAIKFLKPPKPVPAAVPEPDLGPPPTAVPRVVGRQRLAPVPVPDPVYPQADSPEH